MMRTVVRFALGALLLATPAAAQDYPTKPVTIVIPFAAGGAGDILARILSPRLEKAFGRPFVVENKPGAASSKWNDDRHGLGRIILRSGGRCEQQGRKRETYNYSHD